MSATKRVISPSLENVLYDTIPVLDHGFVRVIDYMGNDSSIVQAARVSYGQGTKKTSEDVGLIRYLMRHRHTTPFEMCELKLHIKLPIFVARQWIRHRTASVNEYSGRYSIMSNEFYIPLNTDISGQSEINNQGRSNDCLPKEQSERVKQILIDDATTCYNHYTSLLNTDSSGNIIDPTLPSVSRELARMNLTVNYYTEWYWKINLHNLLRFLSLRSDSHAQKEIVYYATVILDLVKLWVPHTYDAFVEYNLESRTLSKTGMIIVKEMLKGNIPKREDYKLSVREWNELMDILQV